MLGSKALPVFGAAGHEIIAPGRPEADLTDGRSLENLFRHRTFDVLVNCAAFTDVDGCEDASSYEAAMDVNARGPGRLSRLCRETGRRLVHLSTDYVFDGSSDRPCAEDDPLRPVNAYGRTKAEGEKAVRDGGADAIIVRTSWLYGPNGRNFVRTIAGLLRSKTRIDVVDDQVGGPTYTGDLALFLLDLVETGASGGVYHFANEGYVSWRGFAEAIRGLLGLSCEIVPVPSDRVPRKAKRPRSSRFDLSKARAVSRRPLRPWDAALADYLKEDRV